MLLAMECGRLWNVIKLVIQSERLSVRWWLIPYHEVSSPPMSQLQNIDMLQRDFRSANRHQAKIPSAACSIRNTPIVRAAHIEMASSYPAQLKLMVIRRVL